MTTDEQVGRVLAAAAPAFEPVAVDDVGRRVRRRRRAGAVMGMATVAVLAAAALTVPRLLPVGAGTAAVSTAPATRPSGVRPGCPPGQPPPGYAIVDYVDFLQLGGRTYLAAPLGDPQYVPPGRVGRAVAAVQCTLDDIRPDPAYRARDGDAAFLPAGTNLHPVAGWPTSFRLAAAIDGRYRIYEVDADPRARTGADLLPLAGKVSAVEIRGGDAGTRVLGRLVAPDRIRALLDGIARAPVDPDRTATRYGVILRFVLTDGTVVQRIWSAADRLLEPGIVLPPEANAILRSLTAAR